MDEEKPKRFGVWFTNLNTLDVGYVATMYYV